MIAADDRSQKGVALSMPVILDSPRKNNENYFLGKGKKSKGQGYNEGFEYDKDVRTDADFLMKIVNSNNYNPSCENTIDFDDELRRVISTSQTTDKRNVGSIIGATVFGLAGFLLLSFTVIGALAGGVLGVAVGRYAGKKMTKTFKKKKRITQEDFFRIKLQCLLKWGKMQKSDLARNLNVYRMTIEKIVEEFSFALDLSCFAHPKKISKVVIKLRKFLLEVSQQRCILLSYKLFKLYVKQLQGIEQHIEIAKKLHLFFIPYMQILEFQGSQKYLKKIRKIFTYQKIQEFINQKAVVQIVDTYPDTNRSPENIKKFQKKLQEPIDLQAKIKEILISEKQTVDKIIKESDEILKDPNLVALANLQQNPKENQENININLIKTNSRDQSDFSGSEDIDERPGAPVLKNINIKSTPFRRSQNPQTESQHDTSGLNKLASLTFLEEQRSADSSGESDDDDDEEEKNDDLDEDEEVKNLEKRPELFSALKVNAQLHQICAEEFDDYVPRSKFSKFSPKKARANQRSFTTAYVPKKVYEDEDDPMVELPKSNSASDIHSLSQKKEPLEEEEEQKSHVQLEIQKTLSRGSPARSKRSSKSVSVSSVNLSISCKKSGNAQKVTEEKGGLYEKVFEICYDTKKKWDLVNNKPELKVWKIRHEGSPNLLIRGWAIIHDTSTHTVFKMIHNDAIRKKWDTVLADPKVIDVINDNTDVFYYRFNAPFGITDRDWVTLRTFKKDYPQKDHYIISFESFEHPKIPPIKGVIRAHTYIAGYVIKPSEKNPKDCEIYLITQIDIKGLIPKFALNWGAAKGPPDWINKLKKACQTLGKTL